MVCSPKENDAFFGEPQEDAREPGAHADDAETMCVWCEQRAQGACKSHYDTLTCTHRVFVPTAEQWDSAVEARNGEPTHPAQWSAGYDAGFKDGHQAACEALQRDAVKAPRLRDEMCKTCACQPGSVPNGCLQTQLDFLKAASEGQPFLCHAPMDGRICAGWASVRAQLGATPLPAAVVALLARHDYSTPDQEDKTP